MSDTAGLNLKRSSNFQQLYHNVTVVYDCNQCRFDYRAGNRLVSSAKASDKHPCFELMSPDWAEIQLKILVLIISVKLMLESFW